MTDKNCLSYWFPIVRDAGLPVPETRIVRTECDLVLLLDGKMPKGFADFLVEMDAAIREVGGVPCFLRTGQTSHKHDWKNTCYLKNLAAMNGHVARLVEFSHVCDFMGLPHDVWVVRRLIPTTPLFHAFYGHMPIVREFRCFVRDGMVEHVQDYWPEDSILDPSDPDWKRLLKTSAVPQEVLGLARIAGKAIGGYWSVDLLQDSSGGWWLTDMADGDRSFDTRKVER